MPNAYIHLNIWDIKRKRVWNMHEIVILKVIKLERKY